MNLASNIMAALGAGFLLDSSATRRNPSFTKRGPGRRHAPSALVRTFNTADTLFCKVHTFARRRPVRAGHDHEVVKFYGVKTREAALACAVQEIHDYTKQLADRVTPS